MTLQIRKKTKLKYKDHLKILATRIDLANTTDYNQFICSI